MSKINKLKRYSHLIESIKKRPMKEIAFIKTWYYKNCSSEELEKNIKKLNINYLHVFNNTEEEWKEHLLDCILKHIIDLGRPKFDNEKLTKNLKHDSLIVELLEESDNSLFDEVLLVNAFIEFMNNNFDKKFTIFKYLNFEGARIYE